MKKDTVLILAAMGVGGYLLYKAFNIGKSAVDKTAGAIADLWLKLNPMPEALQLLGNVKFPGNILVPIQQLANERAIRKDGSGNVFVKYSGYTWQLAPQVYGNWPATRVG